MERSGQFSEAFYEYDGTGNVDVVLRRSQPSAERAEIEITAIIHLPIVWRPIPGETVGPRLAICRSFCPRSYPKELLLSREDGLFVVDGLKQLYPENRTRLRGVIRTAGFQPARAATRMQARCLRYDFKTTLRLNADGGRPLPVAIWASGASVLGFRTHSAHAAVPPLACPRCRVCSERTPILQLLGDTSFVC